MEIIGTRIYRGPNIWSLDHKLVELQIDLSEVQNFSLASEYFSKNPAEIDFLKKYFLEGMNDVKTEDIFQSVLMEIFEGAHLSTEKVCIKIKDEYASCYLAYPLEHEELSIKAGYAVVRVAEKIFKNVPTNIIAEIEGLKKVKAGIRTGATTSYILSEVENRRIPYRKFPGTSLVTLGYGAKQRKIRTAVTNSTSGIGMEVASDKEETKRLLDVSHFPIPRGILVRSEEGLRERINEVRFPIVTKPLDGNQGRGVTTNINSLEDALKGLEKAQKISRTVIVEEFIPGDDYRFLVIDYKFVAATKRIPAQVKGDGVSTIQHLIDETNKDPMRGYGAECVLSPIKIDPSTERILTLKELTLESVLEKDEVLILKDTANISAGGTALDVTDSVHPENIFLAEHVARIFELDICGIDVMATGVHVPITRETGAIIEVNAGPGLRMHSNPQIGRPRNVAASILNMLFKGIDDFMIPVIAFGCPVSDTILNVISSMAMSAEYSPGYNSGTGISIKNHIAWTQNAVNYNAAQDVLFDPLVNLAMISCDHNDILKNGLPFDYCRISVFYENDEKSLLENPERYEAMRVLAGSTLKQGYCILDADSDLIVGLEKELRCESIYISGKENSARLKKHIHNGKMGACMEDGSVNIYNDSTEIRSVKVSGPLSEALQKGIVSTKEVITAVLLAQIYHLDLMPLLSFTKYEKVHEKED